MKMTVLSFIKLPSKSYLTTISCDYNDYINKLKL